jgi:hypothetical protein
MGIKKIFWVRGKVECDEEMRGIAMGSLLERTHLK